MSGANILSLRSLYICCRLRKELELKMQELQAKLVEDASRVKALGAESNELKAFVEEQLASLLKGRKARITGEFSKS